MSTLPDFEDAAVWVIWPEHLSPDEIASAASALATALPESAPVVSAVIADSGETRRNPLIPIGIYVTKKAIDGAIKVIKDQYEADKAAQKSYDDRAERYNRERDNYFGH